MSIDVSAAPELGRQHGPEFESDAVRDPSEIEETLDQKLETLRGVRQVALNRAVEHIIGAADSAQLMRGRLNGESDFFVQSYGEEAAASGDTIAGVLAASLEPGDPRGEYDLVLTSGEGTEKKVVVIPAWNVDALDVALVEQGDGGRFNPELTVFESVGGTDEGQTFDLREAGVSIRMHEPTEWSKAARSVKFFAERVENAEQRARDEGENPAAYRYDSEVALVGALERLEVVEQAEAA